MSGAEAERTPPRNQYAASATRTSARQDIPTGCSSRIPYLPCIVCAAAAIGTRREGLRRTTFFLRSHVHPRADVNNLPLGSPRRFSASREGTRSAPSRTFQRVLVRPNLRAPYHVLLVLIEGNGCWSVRREGRQSGEHQTEVKL